MTGKPWLKISKYGIVVFKSCSKNQPSSWLARNTSTRSNCCRPSRWIFRIRSEDKASTVRSTSLTCVTRIDVTDASFLRQQPTRSCPVDSKHCLRIDSLLWPVSRREPTLPLWTSSIRWSTTSVQDWTTSYHWSGKRTERGIRCRTFVANVRLVINHLLILFSITCIVGPQVSLPGMIASSSLDSESVALVRDYVNELLAYVNFLLHVSVLLIYCSDGWLRNGCEYSKRNTSRQAFNIKTSLGRDRLFYPSCTTS